MSNDNETNLRQFLADHPVLLDQFANEESTLVKMLFEEVDESDFTFSDWLESLLVLYEWLDERGLELPTRSGLGYVSCAAKSVGNSSTLVHLPSLVEDFLEQYGCESAALKSEE